MKKKTQRALSGFLKDLRHMRRLSLDEVVGEMDHKISKSTLSRIERGKDPSLSVLDSLATVYRVDPWTLMKKRNGVLETTRETSPPDSVFDGLTEDEQAEVLRFIGYLRSIR